MNDIKSKTAQLKGSNANWFIAKDVNAATASVALKGRSWDAETKKLADTLAGAADEMVKLNTTDHDPWLRPEWQVQFEGIMRGLTLALT